MPYHPYILISALFGSWIYFTTVQSGG